MRRLLSIALVAAAASSPPAPAVAVPDPGAAYWIFFRAPETEERLVADAALTPRALARREKARQERVRLEVASVSSHAEPGAADTPPAPDRLAALESTGARLRTVSRWLNAASVRADADALEAIRRLPFVEDVRPVETLAPSTAGGADAHDAGPSRLQLDPIGILEAHAMGYEGNGVLIGVLDSGFILRHEALRHIDVRAQGDFVQGDDDPSDDRTRTPPDPPGSHNHGTQVLSLIAAARPGRMIGSAPRASFLLAKTERSGSETPAEEDNWVAGVEWAEAQGADVITASLSYTNWYRLPDLDGRSAVTTRMANLAWERGVLLLNSAGNAGPRPTSLGAPADAPGTITVGSTGLDGRIARSSSRGPTADGRTKPDVVAPGSGVLVASAGSFDRYHRGSGTSYATPLVAGLTALIVEAHPDWGPEAVREALVMSGDRADRPDNDHGWGIPNARRAILYPLLGGTIRDATTGKPIDGATVVWERVSGPRGEWAAPGDSPAAGETRADAGGGYTVPNLPPGGYRITAAAPGYAARTLGPFDVPPNLEGVDASLEPASR